MKYLFYLFIFLIPGILFGQELSPLLNPMSTNLMNDRPEIFRSIQSNLGEALANTGYGFKASIVSEKFESLKRKFLDKIKSPKLTYNATDNAIEFDFPSVPKIPKADLKFSTDKSFDDLLSDLKKQFNEKVLLPYLKEALKLLEAQQYSQFKEILLSSSFDLLKSSELANGIDGIPSVEDAKGKYEIAISDLVSNIVFKKIRNEIQDNSSIDDTQFEQPIKNLESKLIYDMVDKGNNYLSGTTANVKAKLENISDDVQKEMQKVIDEVNKVLISGNIGLAISEGSGDFGSGLQISWNLASRIQLGTYLNGELSESDTTLPKKSLIAVQGRVLIGDILQLDLLGSLYFGAQKFKSFKYYEYGGGFSVNIGKSVIVGAGYFQLGNANDGSVTPLINITRTLGVFIRSNSPSLPILYLGNSWQQDKSSFGFKVTYPINNKH